MRQKSTIEPGQAMEKVQNIFRQRGTNALEAARKEILGEKFESEEVCDALRYFMTQYWKDCARPTLLSLACEAVGGEPKVTTAVAVPMILISGGIDIHDDIIDDSKIKNERPTVFGKFGKDVALVVGDILLFKGLSLLGQSTEKGVSAAKLPRIIEVVQKLFFELADAEVLEYQYRGRIDVAPEAYLEILWRKAGDVEAHTRVGAIIGGGTETEIKKLSQYGRSLGMMILLRDDWLDTLDYVELNHRLKKECPPLPLLYAAQNYTSRKKIASILQKKNLTKNDGGKILGAVQPEGFEKQRRLMKKISENAYSHLEKVKDKKDNLKLLVISQLPSSTEMKELTTTRI